MAIWPRPGAQASKTCSLLVTTASCCAAAPGWQLQLLVAAACMHMRCRTKLALRSMQHLRCKTNNLIIIPCRPEKLRNVLALIIMFVLALIIMSIAQCSGTV
jgi:hypothetical protein